MAAKGRRGEEKPRAAEPDGADAALPDGADAQRRAAADLRRRAEEQLTQERPREQLTPVDPERTLHELRVHQIELEAQNEQLRETQVELEQARAKYLDLYERAPVGYVTLDDAGCIVEANQAASRLLAGERESLLGRPLSDFFAAADQDSLYLFLRGVVHHQRPETCELRQRELGPPAWLRLDAARTGDGPGAAPTRVALTDVTAQRAAAEEIARLAAMRDVAEQVARVGSIRIDVASGRMAWSPEVYALLDVEPGSAVPDFAEVLETRVHPDDCEKLREAFRLAVVGEVIEPTEVRVVWRDGSEHVLHRESTIERDAGGRPVAAVGYLQDVTERRAMEEALRAADKAEAAERERQRLARDLHDAVTQGLFSANLVLDVLPAELERSPAQAAQDVQLVRRLVRGALGELRTLLYELRPEALMTAPLAALLARLGDAQARASVAEVSTAVDDDVVLPDDVHVAFYRIAQEALSNAGKHARATHVSAVVDRYGSGARLTVRDDGAGFEPALALDGMGMSIMRERAAGIGARLVVTSAPGAGTTVLLEWGAPPEREHDAAE